MIHGRIWNHKNSRKNKKSTGNYYGPSSFCRTSHSYSADTLDGSVPLVDCCQGVSILDDLDGGPEIRCVAVLPSYSVKNADDSASLKSVLDSRNAMGALLGDELESVSCGGSALMGAELGCDSKREGALRGVDSACNSKWESALLGADSAIDLTGESALLDSNLACDSKWERAPIGCWIVC